MCLVCLDPFPLAVKPKGKKRMAKSLDVIGDNSSQLIGIASLEEIDLLEPNKQLMTCLEITV